MQQTDRDLKQLVLNDYFDKKIDKNTIINHYLIDINTLNFWIQEYENKDSTKTKHLSPTIYQQEADKEFHLFLKNEPLLLDMPHYHESVEIILFIKGSATAHIGKSTYKVGEKEICFVDKFQNHFYTEQSPDISVLCLVMGHGFTHHYRHHFKNLAPPPVLRDKKANEKIISLVQTWIDTQDKTLLYNCGQANLVLDAITKSYTLEKENDSDKDILSRKFIDYIENNYRQDISLTTMANYFGYSTVYMSKLFNQNVGQKFNVFLNAVRMQKAMELINASDRGNKTVTTILYECGFDNPVTFYRHYKKHNKDATPPSPCE